MAPWLTRALAAIAVGAVGLFVATAAGAPLIAALSALFAGALAITLVSEATEAQRRAPAPEASEPAGADLAQVLDAIEDPLLIVRDRRVALANAAARAVLGAHIEGADVRLAIRHPTAAERLGDDGSTELVGLGDAERRWEMSTTRLPDGNRLVRLADRSAAHASEQMRTDFVANASHELRTPLATLIGMSETLQDESAAADANTRGRFLKIMFDEARRMQRLVDDLISLSRIEAERFSPLLDSVALPPLVEEVRRSCGTMLQKHGGALHVEDRSSRAVVAGDRTQLYQLLQNLIVNALKYGRPGTDVTVALEDSGDMLRLSVADAGDGIAPEHLPRLTERFYRVDPGRSRAMGGTGLGLAIVKHIVGRHRGRLDIASTPGEGTTVTVWLPKASDPT